VNYLEATGYREGDANMPPTGYLAMVEYDGQRAQDARILGLYRVADARRMVLDAVSNVRFWQDRGDKAAVHACKLALRNMIAEYRIAQRWMPRGGDRR